ncbi:hypothetical protein QL285_034755 [Trifolium repens]|nr:hypothetical protein QL285_034755 [Trifolium repens]
MEEMKGGGGCDSAVIDVVVAVATAEMDVVMDLLIWFCVFGSGFGTDWVLDSTDWRWTVQAVLVRCLQVVEVLRCVLAVVLCSGVSWWFWRWFNSGFGGANLR